MPPRGILTQPTHNSPPAVPPRANCHGDQGPLAVSGPGPFVVDQWVEPLQPRDLITALASRLVSAPELQIRTGGSGGGLHGFGWISSASSRPFGHWPLVLGVFNILRKPEVFLHNLGVEEGVTSLNTVRAGRQLLAHQVGAVKPTIGGKSTIKVARGGHEAAARTVRVIGDDLVGALAR
eukprot:scaffold22547_cov89-Phaeocystis_antarctica.AAC.2